VFELLRLTVPAGDVAEIKFNPAGKLSVIFAPVASAGPELESMISNVICWPGSGEVKLPGAICLIVAKSTKSMKKECHRQHRVQTNAHLLLRNK